jgi:hypothetical protein
MTVNQPTEYETALTNRTIIADGIAFMVSRDLTPPAAAVKRWIAADAEVSRLDNEIFAAAENRAARARAAA